MKHNNKHKYNFVLVYLNETSHGTPYQIFLGMLQSPKCSKQYAWLYALKDVRDNLLKYHIPFDYWYRYRIYPVNRFNCSNFSLKQVDNHTFSYIDAADPSKKEDNIKIKQYNDIIKSKHLKINLN